MPLITAIDEYNCTINRIYAHAKVAIDSGHAEYLEVSLAAILWECGQLEQTIAGFLKPTDLLKDPKT